MEVCKIMEGQRYLKRLNERQITALLKVTCQRPQESEKDIMQTVRHNAYYEDPFAKEFGINISYKFAQVEARILPAPWLKYSESGGERERVLAPSRAVEYDEQGQLYFLLGKILACSCLAFY
ncbi:hypothetical protein MKW92_014096 [Papaver armeniacum]|nr:hypothetical protein MKW92_014096 [Papaver armeniacum]